MKSKIFCVFDSKVEAFMSPFVQKSKGEAIRGFTDAISDQNTLFYKHPEDFTLFEIGEYDETTGTVTPHLTKISLGTALEFKHTDTVSDKLNLIK